MSSIMVQDTEALVRLYEAFDGLGLTHRYSEELGEFEFKINDNEWLMFFVDPQALQEEREAQAWAEDACRVADTYWRQ